MFFGAVMASLAATTLLWRGTVLDHLWAIYPTAYKQFALLGGIAGFSPWDGASGRNYLHSQILGDVVNCVRGVWPRGGTGIIVAGGLLLFLSSQE